MNFNEIWAIIEPYLLPVFESGIISAVVALLAKSALNSVSQKWANQLDIHSIADKVAARLVNSNLNVDITTITEKQIKANVKLLEKAVTAELITLKETIVKQNETLCIMGELLANKSATVEKKEKLIEYLSAEKNIPAVLDEVEEKKETIAIKLDALIYDEDETEQEEVTTSNVDDEYANEVISFT